VEAKYASSSLFAKAGRTNAALCICSMMKINQGGGSFTEAISHKSCSLMGEQKIGRVGIPKPRYYKWK
jgi:hypothetical protein